MKIESISTTLIHRASHGDSAASNRLMELSAWLLQRMTSRIMENREDAEDVVQEALAAVVEIMAKEDLRLKHGRHSYTRLLKTCLRNVSANRFRKKQVMAATGGTDNLNHIQNLIDDNIETVEEKRDIAEGVIEFAGLTDTEKQVLRLLFLSGMSTREIADQLEMTAVNIRQIQSRELRKIRDLLGEDL
ncbi:RNA polymerase sigma factor [Gimesia algae]|uniref:RNA polymerase sigma factor n=1 Tax=Gimesia algae TaxID=2527971 RepID=A0A517VAF4_9PLAN|nr:sigma-70 family RNA polymerase sigma factor [Gimesia algae]QDT89990.1 RNA polymerase sigma factor [Gimesia algae]